MNPTPVAVVETLVVAEYGLGDRASCGLLNSGINDIYAVEIDGDRYALRIQGPDKWWVRDDGEARFELDLLTHLQAHEVSVAYPIPRGNGDPLGKINGRFYTLFSWAADHPTGLSAGEEQQRVGRTLAEIHAAADLFRTDHNRYRLDEKSLLDRAMQVLRPALAAADPAAAHYIEEEVQRIRDQLMTFDPGPGGWGIIHGDVQALNYHFNTDRRPVFFDFDLCGYGWRAYDVAYVYTRIPDTVRESFLDGYQEIRPLSAAEHDMLPVFGKAAWVKERTMVGSGQSPDALVANLRDPYISFD